MQKCCTYVIYYSQQSKSLDLKPQAIKSLDQSLQIGEVELQDLEADRSTSDHGLLTTKFCFSPERRGRLLPNERELKEEL